MEKQKFIILSWEISNHLKTFGVESKPICNELIANY